MTKSIFSAQYDRLCIFLIKARLDAGMSQKELARHLGRPQSFVSKYESKQRRLDVIELLEVVNALRTDGLGFIARLLEGWPENTGAASPGGLWMESNGGPDNGDGRVGSDGDATTAQRRRGAGGGGGRWCGWARSNEGKEASALTGAIEERRRGSGAEIFASVR